MKERIKVNFEREVNAMYAYRKIGGENRNKRSEIMAVPTLNMRSLRSQHIREIFDEVGGSVRIGNVNRFKI